MRSIVIALIALACCASTAQAQEIKVLVYHGPPDATTAPATAAIEALGQDNGFAVDASENATDISTDNLANYRAVVFLNTAGNLLDETQEAALQAFVEDGGGFLGIGSAAEGEPGNSFFDGLIGARPASGSSTDTTEQTVEVGDRVHPATRQLPLTLNRSDVWYEWETRPTGTVHTVARYRAPDAATGDGTDVSDTDSPISWCRDYEGGRSFYTGMGRVPGAYDEPEFRQHLLGALQWTAGLVRANCKATINSSYEATRIVGAGPTETGLATAGESHGLVVAPNGWVVYIGRGDCRTDSERGALLGGGSLGRIFDYADERVGLGCGTVHVWDPEEATGAVNSGVTRAGVIPVYGDMGQGGERTNQSDHKTETGLIGIALAPDFTETGHIYLQYFPSFSDDTNPEGMPLERRISKLASARISRFTLDLETKKLDLDSEVRIFQYDSQIFSCCHRGGGMGFDSAGDLYVTIGDSNSSQGTGGYSGNNPDAKCPTGPPDEASSEHCGDANYSYQDARRTAGSTNDYNGKMIRIKPIASLPDGEQPPVGIGTTYTIPGADAPNGPNLFDGTEGGGGKTKPEIFAMGLRNPSRLSIDPETDTVYSAWVGPDAGEPSRDLGPSTYENAAQITHAGNYGWPYCMGNKQAYRDRVPGNEPRTENAPGYVSGGPSSGGTDGWYDCDNLHNDSPNNTGLTVLPHETGTGMDAGTVRGNNLWYSRGNPDGRNGCPDFPRPRGENAAPDYGAEPVSLCPYAISQGATIMNGPLYRYEEGEDNSRRWPRYWDGRWFLHNNGGPSIKHALLLDPATDQDGGLPVYADSLRDTLSWPGTYMDSKFGPDGALYVQTYDGFFRAGPNVGITRYDYVGGPPTPGAAPRATPIGAYQVRFSTGGSGGVSYAWDFGDGSEPSTEANPVHTYAEATRYTATLTVTYADGSTDSQTVDVDVLAEADETAPVTTAALEPSEPGAGGTYDGPVTVTLTATDPPGGSGVERTEYRINGGEFQGYDAPIRRSQPGMYLIEYRSVDRTGNEEELKSVAFTIAVPQNCPTNLNDEFDGPELDPKWQILRPDDGARSFVDGGLKLLVRAGDMIGGTATAQNVLLQPAPPGSWVIQTKLDVSTLTESGQQAGFVLWNGEDPNTFAKITYISKGAVNQFEWVATRNDQSDIHAGPQSTQAHDVAYLRVSSNGSGTYIPEGSYDGENWVPISSPITDLGDPSTLKFGIKISDNASSDSNYAVFDWFRVDCSDRVPPTTTATLSPEEPDGELGWYTSAPQVTLTADDGELGEVDRIEYTLDGGEARTYEGPFTVEGPGDHVVEYFASDTAGNVETVKRAVFRVDGAAPVTDASIGGAGAARTVTLDASDGDAGSGVVLTQYRVDGGPWTAYASQDEQILDASETSLAQWEQAPSGHFERMDDGSGGITPVGGLGMLWYPVKAYGDFRLKLQFREGRTDGGHSNGGVFVRFPDPRGEPREPCEDYGSAPTSDAWVAIYCGFEIQLYDGPDGEPRKTGSVYTFDNTDSEHMGTPKDVGEWEDYEIEVRGQHYAISRNGELINEFDNDPGIEPDRAGDPSTSLRQFTRGYIGLQNHSTTDKLQYRNVRVEDLTPGAPGANPTGPFEISGDGPHTLQVRSVDAAGNVEDTATYDLQIGSPAPPIVAPAPPRTPLTPVASPMNPPFIVTPASYRVGKFGKRISVGRFTRRGVRVPVECTGAMTGTAKVTVSRRTKRRLHLPRRTLDRDDVRCWGPHRVRVSLKPSKSLARKLKARRGPRRVKLAITIQMRDWGQPATTERSKVTLKRRR